MKNIWRVFLCCCCCCYIKMDASAQASYDYIDAWLFPGITYQYSPATTLEGQLVYLPRQQAISGYAQAFIKKGQHIIFNPGYLYLSSDVSGTPEHTLMNGIIFTTPIGKLVLDNRNVIWNRFRENRKDVHFYRNRLRLSCPIAMKKSAVKIYAFDEVFYLFNGGKWTRNRLAAGCGYALVNWFNLDVAYIRQTDFGGTTAHLFFIMGTIKLN